MSAARRVHHQPPALRKELGGLFRKNAMAYADTPAFPLALLDRSSALIIFAS
jgi:hypothetical protein